MMVLKFFLFGIEKVWKTVFENLWEPCSLVCCFLVLIYTACRR